MADKTLIIHGWSDCSQSFSDMKRRFVERGVGSEEDIYFIDYDSREDDLSYDEVARGLDARLKQEGLIGENGSAVDGNRLNVVVHSTGGLVLRHWLAGAYAAKPDACPVQRIVMLASANFGSPLAHRGKSFVGSLVKGRWHVGDLFEVGRKLLDGLELASPFQWSLAHQDLLGKRGSFFRQQIETTVLVGGSDYSGVRGWINRPGTDGTVVIAGAGLRPSKLIVDYTKTLRGASVRRPVMYEGSDRNALDAFGILPGYDHGSIVNAFSNDRSGVVGLVVQALRTRSNGEFSAFAASLGASYNKDWESATAVDAMEDTTGGPFQQFIFRAIDDYGEPVPDYNLEFFLVRKSRWAREGQWFTQDVNESLDSDERRFSERLMGILMAEGHENTVDRSYRRILACLPLLLKLYEEVEALWGTDDYILGGRIHIPDEVRIQGSATITHVRYDPERLEHVVIFDPSDDDVGLAGELWRANTTTMIEVRIRRLSGLVRLSRRPEVHA